MNNNQHSVPMASQREAETADEMNIRLAQKGVDDTRQALENARRLHPNDAGKIEYHEEQHATALMSQRWLMEYLAKKTSA